MWTGEVVSSRFIYFRTFEITIHYIYLCVRSLAKTHTRYCLLCSLILVALDDWGGWKICWISSHLRASFCLDLYRKCDSVRIAPIIYILSQKRFTVLIFATIKFLLSINMLCSLNCVFYAYCADQRIAIYKFSYIWLPVTIRLMLHTNTKAFPSQSEQNILYLPAVFMFWSEFSL